MMDAKPGDIVNIRTDEEEFSGILMPRPELLEKGIVVVKLESGYNIGIDESRIKSVKVIEKYRQKAEKNQKAEHNKGLKTVSILSTGGTISSKIDYRTGGVKSDYTADDFVQMMPELASFANINARKIMDRMSEDFSSDDWILIAVEIMKELEKADGVVLTMGTDTLHYASAALSFFLRNLSKPVVITAAQKSIDRGSSDAFMNISCAVAAASKSGITEVMTCLHGTSDDDYCLLIRGTKARKMHTSRRDAFRPINSIPIAKVFSDGKIEIVDESHSKEGDGKTELNAKFEKKTAIVYVYPGMDGSVIDFYADKGYKGIVIAATALGHVPETVYGNIEKASKKGVAVVIATQALYGRVHPYVYSALRELSVKRKCIFAEDMTPETAYVKLGWVLGNSNNADKIREMMLHNFAGEISERIQSKSFLF